MGAFENLCAGIVADFGMKLAMSNIDAIDLFGAVLEQAVGKTTRRCSDVQANFASDADFPFIQRRFELFTAARNVFRQLFDLNLARFIKKPAGFDLFGFVREAGSRVNDRNLAREDERLGLVSRLRQSFLDEQEIEPDFRSFGNVSRR